MRLAVIPSYVLFMYICVRFAGTDCAACVHVRLTGGPMDSQFYLHLADIRLLQTWGLLRHMTNKHQDQEALQSAMEAISTARDALKTLRTS